MAKELQHSSDVTNAEVVVGDSYHLPEKYTRYFDLVTMFDALHDLPDADKALEETYKVLADDGILSLSEAGLHTALSTMSDIP